MLRFGKISTESLKYYSKAIIGSTIVGLGISEYVLTDKRIDATTSFIAAQASKLGLDMQVNAFSTPDHGLHPTHYPWEFEKLHKTFDHAALRRGYQVYREVCSACHSMDLVSWRNLVGVSHTEAEVKAMAAEYDYRDGPDETGEYFMRPGKPADPLPKPYKNDEAARAANGGVLPPDFSCISRARKGEMNYIFSLLTGYSEPPAGVTVREGLHYNRYYPGGAIAMARALYDEVVDYEDGTPNNASQLAKDVSEFLHWSSFPEHDERKMMGMKAMIITGTLLGLSIYWKRFKWSYIKSRQIVYKAPPVFLINKAQKSMRTLFNVLFINAINKISFKSEINFKSSNLRL